MFLRVEFRVYSHATEDETKVRRALSTATGGIHPEASKTEGHHGNPIVVLRVNMTKAGDVEAFWRRLGEQGQLSRVKNELETRVDEDLFLHLRLDKQEAYQGRLRVVDHDDIIHVKAKVASYPAKLEKALAVAREYLEGAARPWS